MNSARLICAATSRGMMIGGEDSAFRGGIVSSSPIYSKLCWHRMMIHLRSCKCKEKIPHYATEIQPNYWTLHCNTKAVQWQINTSPGPIKVQWKSAMRFHLLALCEWSECMSECHIENINVISKQIRVSTQVRVQWIQCKEHAFRQNYCLDGKIKKTLKTAQT